LNDPRIRIQLSIQPSWEIITLPLAPHLASHVEITFAYLYCFSARLFVVWLYVMFTQAYNLSFLSICCTLSIGIDSRVISVNFVPVPLYPTRLLSHILPLLIRHSYHPQHPHSFTPTQNLPLSQIFPIIDSLPACRTDSMDFVTRPFLLSNSNFHDRPT